MALSVLSTISDSNDTCSYDEDEYNENGWEMEGIGDVFPKSLKHLALVLFWLNWVSITLKTGTCQ